MKNNIVLIFVILISLLPACKGGDSGPSVAVGLSECSDSDLALEMNATMAESGGEFTVTVTAKAICGYDGIKSAPIDVEFWWGAKEYGVTDDNGEFTVKAATREPLPDFPMVTVKMSNSDGMMVRLKSISVSVQ